MLSKDTIKLIEDSAMQILNPLGFDLIELKSIASGNNLILRFLVDRIEGGITLGECTQLNRQISQLLDEKNIIGSRYIIEVSSPGIDRPLITPKDFKRALGKKVRIFLKEKQSDKLEYEGKITRSDENGILITSDRNEELFIQFSNINRAKRVIS